MNIFHKPEHIGTPILFGAILATVISGSIAQAPELFGIKSTSQPTSAGQSISGSSMTPAELARARAARCTPGFSCGSKSRIVNRVDHKQAVRFALMVGTGVSR